MRALKLVVFALAMISASAAAQAMGGTITVLGDPGDGGIGTNGLAEVLDPGIRVGVGGNDVHGCAAVFFFALPNVPSPAAIVAASLNIEYLGISPFTVPVTPEYNVDLFGIGARSTPTILAADYFDGDAAFSTDTLLAQAFITPSTVPGSLQVTGTGLLNFVASLYQPNGTPTAPYAVFRANADIDLPPYSTPYRGYDLASADNTNSTFIPRLNLGVVPEPSSLVLLSVGILTWVVAGWWRRRR